MTPNTDPAEDVFRTSAEVRRRYGDVSDMWIHRRLTDDSGFPQPMVINRRRFWKLSDLVEWERTRAAGKTAASSLPRFGSGNKDEAAVARDLINGLLREYGKTWGDLIALLGGTPTAIAQLSADFGSNENDNRKLVSHD